MYLRTVLSAIKEWIDMEDNSEVELILLENKAEAEDEHEELAEKKAAAESGEDDCTGDPCTIPRLFQRLKSIRRQ